MVNATNAGTPTCPTATSQAAVHHGASLPGAPKNPAVSADGSTVTWTAPADGGSAIEEYVVTVINDPGDPAGVETVLGTAPGTATSLTIPADRIPQIESHGARVQGTAVNARGQGPASAFSPAAPSTDPVPVLTASTANVGGSISVTPDIVNIGRDDATNVTYQLTYPAVFSNPTAPSSCTVNATNRVITCDTGAIPRGTDKIAPLISFTVGRLTQGTAYPVTATRLSASPFPGDPHDARTTVNCRVSTSNTVTCG